jgi:hypothetical protein
MGKVLSGGIALGSFPHGRDDVEKAAAVTRFISAPLCMRHGQMPHSVMRHQAHGALQGIVRGNRDCGMGHDFQNRHGKRSLPMPRDGMYDVAFQYKAGDCITAFHDQGGDAPLSHPIGGASDVRSRVDCDDLMAFAIQNSLNAHDHSPFFV